jgi:hypothetical protein
VPLDWQVESNNVRILVGCNAPNMYVQWLQKYEDHMIWSSPI